MVPPTDSVIGTEAQAEGQKGWWTQAILPAVFSLMAFAWLSYSRDKISHIWSGLRLGFANADPLWILAVAVLLLSLWGLGIFVSYVIYVDYGRLDKYPARTRIE